jgi:hypothetical protein
MNRELTSELRALAARIDAFLQKRDNPGYLMGRDTFYMDGHLERMFGMIMPWIVRYLLSWGENPLRNMKDYNIGLVGIKISRTNLNVRVSDGILNKFTLKIIVWHDGSLHLLDPFEEDDGTHFHDIRPGFKEKEFINTLDYAFRDTANFFPRDPTVRYRRHLDDPNIRYGPEPRDIEAWKRSLAGGGK